MTPADHVAIRSAPPLDDGVVNVWLLGPQTLEALNVEGAAWIDAEERERAARFRNGVDARRFVGRRAAVRSLAARHLGLTADEIAFDRTCQICGDLAHGRPRLSNGGDERTLRFGVSSAAGSTAIVMSTDFDVAIDIEPVGFVFPSGFSDDDRVFSAAEQTRLATLDGRQRSDLALRWWTAKEAVLKLSGYGLSRPPSTIDVSGLQTDGGAAFYDNGTVLVRDAALAAVGYIGSIALSAEPARIELVVEN
jgi:4'-phosphopantetheinyl transferase